MNSRIYTTVLLAIFAAAPATTVVLFFLEAPYGRYMRRGWGIALSARWGWRIMELPAALVIMLMAILGPSRDPVALFFLAIWEVHYVYRTVVYPFLLRDDGAKSLPVLLVLIAILYNSANGYVNGYHLFGKLAMYRADWVRDPRFALGVALFFSGMAIHVVSDRVLQKLRSPGSRDYRIPHGGLFRYVSSPNYLGEIIEWCGFALATWSLPGLSFALFTIANLLPRAVSNHRWYRRTFPDYPAGRKALIPFVL
jgi:protein-S-isoprenylcysteine O-methyltransferase Ste14